MVKKAKKSKTPGKEALTELNRETQKGGLAIAGGC